MPVPTYDQFIEPLMRLLARNPGGLRAGEAHEAVADALGLTAQDREELVAGGSQPAYKNRAGWAHDRLKRAGLSSSPSRGIWKLRPEGEALLASNPQPFAPEMVGKIAKDYIDVRLRPITAVDGRADDSDRHSTSSSADLVSPDERLGLAIEELRQSAVSELLELLHAVSPAFFERIVLDLLHRMGYGVTREDLQRVGGSGDGGVDGVIALDRLGLEKVYVQAKRWQGSVGRPEVQAFFGALAGQRARKGVFITTSGYTQQAVQFASSVEGIVLVDGDRLARLMIDHELGVSARVVRIPKIDGDYFEEESG